MRRRYIRCFIVSKSAAGFRESGWRRPGQRRRRYYNLTAQGRNVLAAQRKGWESFVLAISRVTGAENA